MITIAEENGPAKATAAAAKAKKKASVGARRTDSAPAKTKSAKKASPAKNGTHAKKSAKGAKPTGKPKAATSGGREGSKTATILDLLKRPGGATAKELLKATGWQPHSLRGFVSGTLKKKMGLNVASVKGEDGERSYSVKA